MEFPVQLIFPLLTSLRPFHIHPVLGKRPWRVAWDTPIREPPALGGGWIYSGHRLCDLDKGIECGPVRLSRNTKFGWPAEFYQKIMQNTVEQLGKKNWPAGKDNWMKFRRTPWPWNSKTATSRVTWSHMDQSTDRRGSCAMLKSFGPKQSLRSHSPVL